MQSGPQKGGGGVDKVKFTLDPNLPTVFLYCAYCTQYAVLLHAYNNNTSFAILAPSDFSANRFLISQA